MPDRPLPDLELDSHTVWEDVFDFIDRAHGLSETEFDEQLSRETDFSPHARLCIWNMAVVLWESKQWDPPDRDDRFKKE